MTNRRISTAEKIFIIISLILNSAKALTITTSQNEVQTSYTYSQTTMHQSWSLLTNESESIVFISDGVAFETKVILPTPSSIFDEMFSDNAIDETLESIPELSTFEAFSSNTETFSSEIMQFSSSENPFNVDSSMPSTLEWSAPTESFWTGRTTLIAPVVESTSEALDGTSKSDTVIISVGKSILRTDSFILSAADSEMSSDPNMSIETFFTSAYELIIPTFSSAFGSTSSETESFVDLNTTLTSTSVLSLSSMAYISSTTPLSSYSLEAESFDFESQSVSGGTTDIAISSFEYTSDTPPVNTETWDSESYSVPLDMVSSSSDQSTNIIIPSNSMANSIELMSTDITPMMSETYSMESLMESVSAPTSESFSFDSKTDEISSIKSSSTDVSSEAASMIEPSSEPRSSPGFSSDISYLESSTDHLSFIESTFSVSEMDSEIIPSTSMFTSSSDSTMSVMTSHTPSVSATTDPPYTSTVPSSTTRTTETVPGFIYPTESPNPDAISLVFSFELKVSRNFSEIEDTHDREAFIANITDMLTEVIFVNIRVDFHISVREGSIIATIESTIEAGTLNEVHLTFPEAVMNITNNFLVNKEHIKDAIPYIDFNTSLDSIQNLEDQVIESPCIFVKTQRACTPSYTFQCVDGVHDICIHRCVEAGNQCGENGVCFYDLTLNATACRCTSDSYRVYHGSNCEESTATLSFVLALSLGIGCGLLFICCLIIIALVSHRRKERKNSGNLNSRHKRKQDFRDSTRSNEAYHNGEYIPTMTGDTLSTFKYGPTDGYSNQAYRESTPL